MVDKSDAPFPWHPVFPVHIVLVAPWVLFCRASRLAAVKQSCDLCREISRDVQSGICRIKAQSPSLLPCNAKRFDPNLSNKLLMSLYQANCCCMLYITYVCINRYCMSLFYSLPSRHVPSPNHQTGRLPLPVHEGSQSGASKSLFL